MSGAVAGLSLALAVTWSAWTMAPSARGPVELPPAKFKGLRSEVVRTLEALHCRVPQRVGDNSPHNVVKGEFLRKGSTAWAVLCWHDGRESILVFDAQGDKPVVSLGDDDNSGPTGEWGGSKHDDYTGTIGRATPKYILQHDEWYGNIPPAPKIEHDGINAGSDKGSVIFYFHDGKWRTLSGAD